MESETDTNNNVDKNKLLEIRQSRSLDFIEKAYSTESYELIPEWFTIGVMPKINVTKLKNLKLYAEVLIRSELYSRTKP